MGIQNAGRDDEGHSDHRATDLLFVGGREGYFHALDARTGALLWKVTVGGETAAARITYEVGG